jgi:hypothetical protein
MGAAWKMVPFDSEMDVEDSFVAVAVDSEGANVVASKLLLSNMFSLQKFSGMYLGHKK